MFCNNHSLKDVKGTCSSIFFKPTGGCLCLPRAGISPGVAGLVLYTDACRPKQFPPEKCHLRAPSAFGAGAVLEHYPPQTPTPPGAEIRPSRPHSRQGVHTSLKKNPGLESSSFFSSFGQLVLFPAFLSAILDLFGLFWLIFSPFQPFSGTFIGH